MSRCIVNNVVISEIVDQPSRKRYRIHAHCPSCKMEVSDDIWLNLSYEKAVNPHTRNNRLSIGQRIKSMEYDTHIYSKWKEGYDIINIEWNGKEKA